MNLVSPSSMHYCWTGMAIARDHDSSLFSITSDIDLDGRASPQSVRATAVALEVSGADHAPRRLARARITAFRTTATIGSGLLQAEVDGSWIDLLRFGNRLRFSFERAVKRLEAWREGLDPGAGTEEQTDPQRCGSCGLMLEFVGETCPRCLDHGAALGRVARMVRPYRREAAVLLALLAAGLVLDMAWPLLTRLLVDFVLTTPRPPLPTYLSRFDGRAPERLLGYIVLALASVHVVRAGLNVVTSKLSAWVGNAMTFEVRAQLVGQLERLGLAYYNKQETGSLVGRVAYDTDAIQGFMSQVTSGFVMQFCLVVFSFAMMVALEPRLAVWALIPAPFVLGGAFVYWRFVHPRYQRFWDRTSKQAGVLNGILTGIRVVKAFAKEDYELDRFCRASLAVRHTKDALDHTAAYFYPLMGIVFQVGGWIVWYVGGRNVLDQRVSVGVLMAFFGYLSMFYGPLGNLTNLTTWLTQFSTQMHRIGEILDAPTVIPEAPAPVPAPTPAGRVEFRDVTFSYTRGAPVLNGVSFAFAPGEQIGVVGRSGSGKTSLINLIYRFYDVDAGQVLLDGVDVRSLAKDDLRRNISIVLQEPFLFHGTLLENIAYGQADASPGDVIAASRAANAHDFVMAHQLAYETPVGERGQELSGGERQRISIARAFLRRSKILILDEATSAIDGESELSIQRAIADVSRSRTTILIAHRLSTLQNCDRILVLDNGQVAECGSPRELLAQDGLYARWVRLQQGRRYVEWDEAARSPAGGEDPDAHRPRWLTPDRLTLWRGANGDLRARVDGGAEARDVFCLRCFPVTHAERYLSLRCAGPDGRTRELGLIRDLGEWDDATRALVRGALDRRYLFHRVERLYAIRKFATFLAVSARTHLGDVDFVLRYGAEAVKAYGARGRLLVDIEDNLYVIPDVAGLSTGDRATFERYVYW